MVADGTAVDNNRVFDGGPDGPHGDYGIINFGSANEITKNKIRGYEFPTYLADGQVEIPTPHEPAPLICFGTDCTNPAP